MSRDNLNTSASCPPTPTSISSRTSSIPVSYKPLSPSASLSSLFRVSDEELKRKSSEDLLQIIRRLETETKNFLAEHANIMKDVNRKIQINLLEIKGLKDINQKLQDDNQELRDLSIFLDDDRQKGRKLAREWQRFGRYTASVMRSEVSSYQEKLKDLEVKQEDMMHDNEELKELCLYLDQERSLISPTQTSVRDRDEGDGSSNSTVHNEEHLGAEHHNLVDHQNLSSDNNRRSLNGETADYIRQLEDKIHQLEDEKRLLGQRAERNGAEGHRAETNDASGSHSESQGSQSQSWSRSSHHTDKYPVGVKMPSSHTSRQEPNSTHPETGSLPVARTDARQRRGHTEPPSFRRGETSAKSPGFMHGSSSGPQAATLPPSKPEAVVHAMKVLEVHEQLERPKTDPGEDKLDDNEKAIVREMCNVVWRKLGDVADSTSQKPPRSGEEDIVTRNDSPPPRPHMQNSYPPSVHHVRKNTTSPPKPQVKNNYPTDSQIRRNSPPPRHSAQNYFPPNENSYVARKAKSPPPRPTEQDPYPRKNVKTPPPIPSDNRPPQSFHSNTRSSHHHQPQNIQQNYYHPDSYSHQDNFSHPDAYCQPLPPRDYYRNSKPQHSYHQSSQISQHSHPPPPPPSKHMSNVHHAPPYPHRSHPNQSTFPQNYPHQQTNNPNPQFSHIKSPPRPPRQTYERRQTYLDDSEHAV